MRVSKAHQQRSIAVTQNRPGGWTRAFVTVHVAALLIWTIPISRGLAQDMREFIRPYMLWTGLFQSWDTFAPNPPSTNTDLKAMIVTASGHPRVFSFPRMQELSFSERYRKERYRKFVEAIVEPQFSIAWPDIARHAAAISGQPTDKQEKVMLIHFRTQNIFGSDEVKTIALTPHMIFDDYVSMENE